MKPKPLLSLAFALMLALFLCACTLATSQAKPVQYTAGGTTLSVPGEYEDLLVVETADGSDQNGTLFSVHEKASLESAKNQFGDEADGGFLFSIGKVTKDVFLDMVCQDMPNMEAFATDEAGNYYIYYHPTDVQLVRDSEFTNDDWNQWFLLEDWSATVEESFLSDNPDLTAYTRTYTDLDLSLCRIYHWQQDALLVPNTREAAYISIHELSLPFVERLIHDVEYAPPTEDNYPSGPFITLALPNLLWTFDFYVEEGSSQYIRQTFGQEGYIYLQATSNGEPYPVGEVVDQWLSTIAPHAQTMPEIPETIIQH